MAPVSSIAHQLEYHRLHIEFDADAGIDAWSVAFDLAWGDRLLDRCRQLLFGVRSTELTLRCQGIILRSRALLAMVLVDNVRADDYQCCLWLFRRVGDRYLSGRAINDLGTLHQAHGDLKAAIGCYQQALERHRETGFRLGEATTLANIGGLYYARGYNDQALQFNTEAAAIFVASGDRNNKATTRNNLAVLHRLRGNLEQAVVDTVAAPGIFKKSATDLWKRHRNLIGEGIVVTNDIIFVQQRNLAGLCREEVATWSWRIRARPRSLR